MHRLIAAGVLAGLFLVAPAANAACDLDQLNDSAAAAAIGRSLTTNEKTIATATGITNTGRTSVWFKVVCTSSMEALSLQGLSHVEANYWNPGPTAPLHRNYTFTSSDATVTLFGATSLSHLPHGTVMRLHTVNDENRPTVWPLGEPIANGEGHGFVRFLRTGGGMFEHDVHYPPL